MYKNTQANTTNLIINAEAKRILFLCDQEKRPCELESEVDIKMPQLLKRLKMFVNAGYLIKRKKGFKTWYKSTDKAKPLYKGYKVMVPI